MIAPRLHATTALRSTLFVLALASALAGCPSELPVGAPTCADRLRNGTESDVDCGGACGATCDDSAKCRDATDCRSGRCDGTSGTCIAPPAPKAERLAPPTGPSSGGTLVTISGTGFVAGLAVRFGSERAASVRIVSPQELEAVTPPHEAALVDVTVFDPEGASSSIPSSFSFYDEASPAPAPTIDRILPASGPVEGGSRGVLAGSGFVDGARIYFRGSRAPIATVIDAARLSFVTPPGAAGSADVLVVNPDGRAARAASGFAFHDVVGAPPVIDSVSPSSAPERAATTLFVNGSGFSTDALVFVGDVPAGEIGGAGTRLSALAPLLPPGTYDVTVTNSDGRSATREGAFAIAAPTCADGVLNGLESDADCGEACEVGCASDARCRAGADCLSGVCDAGGRCRPCVSNAACTPGQACVAGVCGRCGATSECSAGQACVGGACGLCARSDECADGDACLAGVCGPCATSAQCASGKACIAGRCRACTESSQCAAGDACLAGVCGPCTATDECAPGQACVAGACGACTSRSQCLAGQACVLGACGPCSTNVQCGLGQACVEGRCGSCSRNNQCEAGEACVAGACGACSDNAQCSAGEACVAGSCGACASSSQCGEGQVCAGGACGACTSSSQCGGGRVCVDGSCGPCVRNAQCAAGLACISGACGACRAASDCNAGQACIDGACAACTSNEQCGGGRVCVSGACGECTASAQCGGGRVCLEGACAACASTAQCAAGEACVNGACGACSRTSECAGSDVCVAGRCGPCGSNRDCAQGLVCFEGACRACAGNSQCEAGEACVGGACGPCGGNRDCATGQVCVAGACSSCSASAQCDAGEVCRSGACDRCAATTECAAGEACVNGLCGACSADADCGSGRACVGGVCREPLRSCLEWKNAGQLQSGAYLVDADGAGASQPFRTYCDMTSNGGGWTLVASAWIPSYPMSAEFAAIGQFIRPGSTGPSFNSMWLQCEGASTRVDRVRTFAGAAQSPLDVVSSAPTETYGAVDDVARPSNLECYQTFAEWHGFVGGCVGAQRYILRVDQVHCAQNYTAVGGQFDNPVLGKWGRIWVR